MKFKLSKVLAVCMAISLLSVSAIAVVTYADWQDGTGTKTMNKTDTAFFDAALFSTSSLTYSIDMYNPSGVLVKTFDIGTSNDGWVELIGLKVNRSGITVGGVYTIYINSIDGNGLSNYTVLTLNILNKAPVITGISAPASVNAGEVLSVSFTASDPDNDTLSYRIYRNNISISNLSNDAWQTTDSNIGVYTYRFEVSDGDDTVSQTRTIAVNAAGTPKAGEDIPEVLRLGKNIEISKIYNFLKIRSNEGRALDDFEITVTYIDLNKFETYNFDLERNDVVYKPLTTNLSKGTWLAKIDIKAEDVEDSGYLLIRK